MSASLPVVALVFLGVVVALLGLFAAGSLEFVIVGLVAIAAAGVIAVLGQRRS